MLLSLTCLGCYFGICLAYSLTSNSLEVAVNVLISFSNLKYIPVVRDSKSHPNKTKRRLYFIVYLKMLQHLLPWLNELISFKPCFQVLSFVKQRKQLQQGKNQILGCMKTYSCGLPEVVTTMAQSLLNYEQSLMNSP